MPFSVFVLHLYGRLLLFFGKIASFAFPASEPRLDHGKGFFAGSCALLNRSRLCSQRAAWWQLDQKPLYGWDGSEEENSFCLTPGAWLGPSFAPLGLILWPVTLLESPVRYFICWSWAESTNTNHKNPNQLNNENGNTEPLSAKEWSFRVVDSCVFHVLHITVK